MGLLSNPKMRIDHYPLPLHANEESWALKVNIPPELLIVKLVEALSHKDATIKE